MAASAGGGSVAGANAAGFDLADMTIESGLQKYIRRVQVDLLKTIDNEAVLNAYGIEVSHFHHGQEQNASIAAVHNVDAS